MTNDLQKYTNDLSSTLDAIQVPENIKNEIIKDETGKGIRGTILETLGLGSVEKIFSTAENVEAAMKEYKKALLMQAYMDKTENIADEVEKLEKFVTSAEGNILFNKIIRILNTNVEDREYIEILGRVLKMMTNSDFINLFSKYVYALNQIDKLTPQALIILLDYKIWPEFLMTRYSSNEGVIVSEWVEEFMKNYVKVKKIEQQDTSRRIAHALRELLRNNLILARMKSQNDSKDMGSVREANQPAICELTELGSEIIDYVENKKT